MARNYPKLIKSDNPKSWQNIAWMDDAQGQVHILSLSNGLYGAWYKVKFFGCAEEDGASIDQFADLGAALTWAHNWIRKTCNVKANKNGTAMNELSVEVDYTSTLYTFLVFLRDKDRARIYCRVYTDSVHGGSVVLWADRVDTSDIHSVAQLRTMVERVADFARQERLKY